MRVAVVGATGRSGRLVVERLRERGHAAVALVRDAQKAGDLAADDVREAEGTDPAALAAALARFDAVASCVGPVKGESSTVMRDAMRALLEAMAAAGVPRVVAITASGWIVDGDDPLSRFVAKPLLGVLLREANADLGATEALLRASDRDWTIVRPPRLVDGAARGRYSRRIDGNVRWGYDIRRADLATAVVDALEDPGTVRHVVSVAR